MKRKKGFGLFFTIIAVIGVVFLSISLSSCQALGGRFGFGTTANTKTSSTGIETAVVRRGNIIQTISTTGTVDSAQTLILSPKISGEVLQSINVGNEVKKGDVILKVDNSDLKNTVAQAQINVENAQNSLKEARINYQAALDANHVAIQLAQLQNQLAQNSTQSAQNSINNTENNGNASIENAQLAVKKAQDSYNYSIAQAQIALNQAADKLNANSTTDNNYAYQSAYLSRDSAVASATNALNSAIAALNQADAQARASNEEARIAYENSLINQSSTYWNTLLNQEQALQKIQSSAISLDSAQKQVELAKLNLEQVSKNLDNDTIVAPFDGVILSSTYQTGQIANAGSSAITIASKDFIITSTVNETDMPKVAIGNKATVNFDAYPDQIFNGEVISISSAPTISNNITSYEIKVKLDKTDNIKLLYGLSTNLTVITARADNVLMVPIQAVYKENGKEYVDVLVNPPSTNKTNTSTSKAKSNTNTNNPSATNTTGFRRTTNNTNSTSGGFNFSQNANNFTITTINPKDITADSIKKVEVTTGISNYNFIEIKSGLKEGDIVITSNIKSLTNVSSTNNTNANYTNRTNNTTSNTSNVTNTNR